MHGGVAIRALGRATCCRHRSRSPRPYHYPDFNTNIGYALCLSGRLRQVELIKPFTIALLALRLSAYEAERTGLP